MSINRQNQKECKNRCDNITRYTNRKRNSATDTDYSNSELGKNYTNYTKLPYKEGCVCYMCEGSKIITHNVTQQSLSYT